MYIYIHLNIHMYNLTILNPKHKILNSYLLWNGKKNSSTPQVQDPLYAGLQPPHCSQRYPQKSRNYWMNWSHVRMDWSLLGGWSIYTPCCQASSGSSSGQCSAAKANAKSTELKSFWDVNTKSWDATDATGYGKGNSSNDWLKTLLLDS